MAKCIGVLADDLTGSMDAGVQLLNDGYTVKIAVDPSSLDVVSENTDIIIINSESRNISKSQSYAKVQYCVKKLHEMDCSLIYKKVDSTLRGNIGIELEAVLNQLNVDCIILAPALPFNERTTVNGIHYVGGIRLQDTELAKDPFSPIYSSSIREIIRKQSPIPSANLTIDIIRDSVAYTTKVMEEMINSGIKVIVCDAIDNGDLTCIAKASNRLSHTIVFCGSAGLFKYLVDTGRINEPARFPAEQIQYSNQSESVLVLSGSPTSISKKQIFNAVNSGNRTTAIYADLARVNGTKMQQEEEHNRIFFEVEKALKKKHHVIVEAAGRSKMNLLFSTKGDFEKLNRDSENIQRLLADVAEQFINYPVKGLVLFGGDTAMSIATRIRAKGIHILSQVEPYIPMGVFIESKMDTIPVVTKAGGFGNENTLVNILNHF